MHVRLRGEERSVQSFRAFAESSSKGSCQIFSGLCNDFLVDAAGVNNIRQHGHTKIRERPGVQ